MVDGPEESEGDGGNPEDGKILSPEELDISDDEHVTKLDEGRFVVSPDARQDQSRPPAAPSEPQESRDRAVERQQSEPVEDRANHAAEQSDERAPPADALDRETVRRWLRESFEGGGSRYGFDITATFDGSVSQRRMASNDVVTIFESLLLWYAQQVDDDTAVEDILGILLTEANVPIRYPTGSLRRLVDSADLGPEDTIADLFEAIGDDGIEL